MDVIDLVLITKSCDGCGIPKDGTQFYRYARRLSNLCRDCCVKTTPAPRRPTLTPIQRFAADSFNRVQKRSIRDGKEFNLDKEFISSLIEDFCSSHYYRIGEKNAFQPSIDRIDRSRGYTKDNIRIVWLIENLARNTFSEDELIEFCQRKLGLRE